MKNSMKKSGLKEKIKVNDSNINKNNISQSQTVEKNINIIEQLSNLTSLYNALSFINLKFLVLLYRNFLFVFLYLLLVLLYLLLYYYMEFHIFPSNNLPKELLVKYSLVA